MILLHGLLPSLAARSFKPSLFEGCEPGARSTSAYVSCVMRGIVSSLIAIFAVSACADPVHDDAVAKLGGELAGVPPGPLHRPGQPCELCHSSRGGESEFSLAGTVYVDALSQTPIEDVNVRIVDSQNRRFVARTNCAGNFFIKAEDFEPDFPIWLGLDRGAIFRDMDTAVYRERSCAGCHADPKGLASAGHVFLIEDLAEEQLLPVSRCR
jgi:hypothetical protein